MVPRHLQQWVLIGTAVVMVGILALSGPPATPRATATSSPAAVAVDPNQQRIEDYQRRIQEQAQRLAAEQAQLQLTKDALAADPDGAVSRARLAAPSPSHRDRRRAAAPARDAREDRARFADNVAFSRSTTTRVAEAAPTVNAPVLDAPAGTADDPAAVVPPPAGTPGPSRRGGRAADAARRRPPRRHRGARRVAPTVPGEPRYTLFEGTIIETVLTNRLDGTFSGPVNCLVSVPVYAADHLVIPAGARVLGEARAVNTFGQSRLAVTFHRVILPNGGRTSTWTTSTA